MTMPVSGKTLTRWECDRCGRVGLLNDPSRGWHIDGWHMSARPVSECMIGPGEADSRCFGEAGRADLYGGPFMTPVSGNTPPVLVAAAHDGYVHLPAVIADAFGRARSEARRLIAQGAVSIDGRTHLHQDIRDADVHGGILRVGKRASVAIEVHGLGTIGRPGDDRTVLVPETKVQELRDAAADIVAHEDRLERLRARRNALIRELLAAILSECEIGRAAGVSGPFVHQIKKAAPNER